MVNAELEVAADPYCEKGRNGSKLGFLKFSVSEVSKVPFLNRRTIISNHFPAIFII